MTVPLRVAVMGCVVNGPGEAREADLGVASGNGKGQIFVKGEVIKTVPEAEIVATLIEEANRSPTRWAPTRRSAPRRSSRPDAASEADGTPRDHADGSHREWYALIAGCPPRCA
jgi:(E)-4-hydroxy-3-methylbut-2-enyl-diphosphate synthase